MGTSLLSEQSDETIISREVIKNGLDSNFYCGVFCNACDNNTKQAPVKSQALRLLE